MNPSRATWICFLLGLGLAAAKLATSFLPYGNAADFALFGLAAGAVARAWPDLRLRLLPWLAVPAVLVIAYTLVHIGASGLRRGIGTHWAWAVMLVPLATLVGGTLGARARPGPSDRFEP